jgi:hypothetical protein
MELTNKHIIYTLGINTPTLTEYLNGNKNSLQLIMEEQMLYESFMDSIKTYAKEKWNKTITTIKDWKDTAAAVYQMIASGKIEELIGPVFRYGIKIPVKILQALLDKTGLGELYKKYVLPIINKLSQLKGWKGFIVTLSIGSIIKYITTKLSHLSSDGLKKWILAYFSDNTIENIISKLTNFSTFISWLQPIIKGTEIIFDILKPSLDRIKSGEEIGKMLQPKTNENLNFNKNKMKNETLKNLIKEEIKNILKEEQQKPEVEKIQKYLEGPGKTALSQINNPVELKNVLTLLWNGMNENFRSNNSIAVSLKKIIDTKIKG